jgi:hypothetical protein
MAPPAGFVSCLTGFGVCWLARDFGLELGQQVGVRARCVQLGGWVERIQPHNRHAAQPTANPRAHAAGSGFVVAVSVAHMERRRRSSQPRRRGLL